jgi:hypothetical protein
MKRIITNAACIICLLLAALPSNAQQAKAPAAQIVTGSEQKAASQNTATEVKAPAKPADMPFQKSEVKQQQQAVAPEKPAAEEPKAIEVSAATQKGMPIKNADRPKTSTIQPDKKVRPMAATGPAAPNQ